MSHIGQIIGECEAIGRVGEQELTVQWRIQGDVLTPDRVNEEWFRSPLFRFGDEEWYLRLYLNWRETWRPPSGWLELGLDRWDEGPTKSFRFSVSIGGPGGVEVRREVEREFSGYDDDNGISDGHYWTYFCSISEIEEITSLMPDGHLAITCVLNRSGADREANILLRSEQNVLESGEDSQVPLKEQGVEELQSSLKSMLISGEDSDVLMKVQGKEFRAHRSILRARSPVFHAMFTHDMVEKQSNIVTMGDCDGETFPQFLEHVYTGSVEMVSTENVLSLYSASEKYDLKTLKKSCSEFLKNNLTVAFFCNAFTLAVKYGDKELIERATKFYCNNALEIVQTAAWQIFLAENPTVGNELYINQLKK